MATKALFLLAATSSAAAATNVATTNYQRNVNFINTHNNMPNSACKLAVNKFSHLSHEEFKAQYQLDLSHVELKALKNKIHSYDPKILIDTDSLDWAAAGATSSVEDQGVCAACWAFSATGGLEGAHFIKTGELTKLSVQNLLNCDDNTEDNGCHGTYYGMDSAFNWITSNGGLCSNENYPFVGENSTDCDTTCSIVPDTSIVSTIDVEDNEDALLQALLQQPISVVLDASCPGFMSYESGVWTEDCGTKLDHAVLLVGFGHDEDTGLDFWKIKNSMGTDWGEEGYMRLQRGLSGQDGHGICDISAMACYPQL